MSVSKLCCVIAPMDVSGKQNCLSLIGSIANCFVASALGIVRRMFTSLSFLHDFVRVQNS